jgi:ABC-type branched-subunit amino acid transport system ATPase component
VRNNERAGAAAGINVSANKLLAFGVASFLAGISGALIGYSRGQLSADSFSTFVNISFLAFAYLGGITSVSGALVAGTLAPLGIGYVISDRLLEAGSVYTLMAGLSLIFTAIFNPIGIAGATRANMAFLLERFSRRPSAADVAPAVTTSHDHAAGNGHAPGESATDAPAYQRPIGPRAERAVRLRTTDLTVRYGGVVAVDRVTLQIHEGEVVGLIGPNGAGKTSFMDGLTGFTVASGAVEFDGAALEGLAPHARARRGLARTWQSVELFGDLSVRDNIRVACEPASITSFVLDLVHPRRDTDHHEVDRALEMVGLSHLADERPDNLSLGQQKLLGVARALAARPGVVLMDEPAAGLDTTESQELGHRLREIVAEGTSVFLIDHDMGLVLDVCDYIYVLEFGTLIAEGTPSEIRANPAVIHAYLGSSGQPADEQGADLVVDGAQ